MARLTPSTPKRLVALDGAGKAAVAAGRAELAPGAFVQQHQVELRQRGGIDGACAKNGDGL